MRKWEYAYDIVIGKRYEKSYPHKQKYSKKKGPFA